MRVIASEKDFRGSSDSCTLSDEIRLLRADSQWFSNPSVMRLHLKFSARQRVSNIDIIKYIAHFTLAPLYLF